jgi:hypothetical protein
MATANTDRPALFPKGKERGSKVASRQYIMRQVATLLKFAKETNDQKVAGALIEKAASLQARVDERLPAPDWSSRAPHVEPSPLLNKEKGRLGCRLFFITC